MSELAVSPRAKYKCCRHCRHRSYNRSIDGHATPCAAPICARGKVLSDTPGSRTFWTRWSEMASL